MGVEVPRPESNRAKTKAGRWRSGKVALLPKRGARFGGERRASVPRSGLPGGACVRVAKAEASPAHTGRAAPPNGYALAVAVASTGSGWVVFLGLLPKITCSATTYRRERRSSSVPQLSCRSRPEIVTA